MVQSLRVNSCQYTSTASSLSIAWHELRRRYLPVAVADRDSIWRYSRGALPDDPDQGWKLHVSATVLTATKVLSAVGPLLKGRNVLFKGPVSLVELGKLNAGIHYGYSQVGKFLTIYPKTSAEAVLLAQELYRLTRLCQGPSVPFDRKYRKDGFLYYRYCAFKSSDESERFTISDPQGNAIADDRESETTPSWEIDPFRTVKPNVSATGKSNGRPTLLQTTFKPFRALAQRGKGGVYQALDLSRDSPRLCLLKEGRRGGEIDFDGRDGVWRVRHEKRVLARLRASAVEVPEVYGSFAAEGNYYLALEFIDGANFEEFLHGRTRRLSITEALGRSMEIALLMSRIHAAGWVWRECKPRPLILTRNRRLPPVDSASAS